MSKPTCVEVYWAVRIGNPRRYAPYWMGGDSTVEPRLFHSREKAMEKAIELGAHATVHRVVIADLPPEEIKALKRRTK